MTQARYRPLDPDHSLLPLYLTLSVVQFCVDSIT